MNAFELIPLARRVDSGVVPASEDEQQQAQANLSPSKHSPVIWNRARWKGPSPFTGYDAERRPATAEIVRSNRRGGPEGVIDLVEARAPDGFEDVEAAASSSEREAIVRGYASMAGYGREQVNRAYAREES